MFSGSLFKSTIKTEDAEKLKRSMMEENLGRGKFLALAMIGFELIFALLDLFASLLKVHSQFHFSTYFMMYLLMIFINLRFFLFAKRILKNGVKSERLQQKIETAIVIYTTLILCWGSVVSLMDQALYGQLMVFMINVIICSLVFLMSNKQMLVPYALASLILYVGLPFFQSSVDVLVGHYVNITVFIAVSWLASRILFKNYCNSFNDKEQLKKSNALLHQEIEENAQINKILSEKNLQMSQLSLSDELTGIPNRRAFRNFIDIAFESYAREGMKFSVILMDIDYFKRYNDRYGHLAGDKALMAVSEKIISVVGHDRDFAARWGGEEFIYASFETDMDEIRKIAEEIQNKVQDLKIPHEASKASEVLTLSLGICTFQLTGHSDISRSIEAADKALYLAKASGRNCIQTCDYNEG
jgi:diguanylate cyclase (GGDEF)-like protein